MYRRYVTLHLLAVVAAFGIAALWIIISATRHGAAVSQCLQDFFATSASNEEGTALCDIFAWVDIGLMGALWLFLAAVQVALFTAAEAPILIFTYADLPLCCHLFIRKFPTTSPRRFRCHTPQEPRQLWALGRPQRQLSTCEGS